MEARILGPLEILVEGKRVDIRGRKQRDLLAVLLIHANEVVTPDALIEELWGESPPPSALKTLQAYVSRLRRSLEPDGAALETHGHGYRLRVDARALDADLFLARLEEGRRALAAGKPESAARELREALDLWRGPALAEFRYENFAQAEIERLEELRLAAQEERIEAELGLGRHAELVPELEALSRAHPLRERVRAQLMLALYRSGRQAEALQAYQEARRALAEELGLEPSESLKQLERRILEHDPALAAHGRAVRPTLVPAPARRHPRLVLATGALVLTAAIVAAAVQLTRDDSQDAVRAGAVALDPESGEVLSSVPLGTAPSGVAVGGGSVWVLDADDRTVSQIDAESRSLARTFSTSSTPTDIAAGAGAVWIGNAPSAGSVLPTSVSRLDPESGLLVETIELPPAPGGNLYGVFPGASRQHIAVSADAVWVISPDLTVSRIDPRSNRVVARVKNVRAENIAIGDGDVWVTEGNRVTEIDPSVNAVARRIELQTAGFLSGIAVGGGAVWATDPFAGSVWRIDTGPKFARRVITLETWVAGVTFGEGAVWVTNEIADEIHRIDPRTSTPKRIGGTTSPRALDAGEGAVWVTAATPPSRDAALPAAVCRDVYYGREGQPDVLLVSSLSLQGPSRNVTGPMVDGVRFVLEQRGFEAGPYSVGYQSCDSSTAQAGNEDFFRCGSIAKAFSRNLRVVGVFGSYTSFCSYLQIPITNAAPGGPLAMMSPSNTHWELTDDDGLYPSGSRSFFRLAAADQYQGPAQVELAKQLGHSRLFLLISPGEEYGPYYPEWTRVYAKRAGVELVGTATFDPDAESFGPLARQIARANAESVAIVGLLTPGTATMIRELRAALGPKASISAPDAFQLDGLFALAGSAAEGMYVTVYGVPNDRLPPRGRQFLAALASERGGDPGADGAASYGAQATEIFLDAIARSDGTRGSVTEQLRGTKVRNGILGNVSWNAKGDLREGPITIFRVEDGEFVVDRVVVVRPPRGASRNGR